MIRIENLTRRFGQFTAVDNLSFSVAPGEVLGFLGPNGAGKSTTMKMICGFLQPTAGSVNIFGADMWRDPLPAKAMIGYLPEGAPSYGEMSVAGFLDFIAAVRGLRGSAKQQAIAAAVDKVALREVLQQSIETLSKGYRRRVGLAQALLHDPRVLVLDEPTDGLDPNQKHQVRELIRNLSQEKLVIVSTHILEEVSAVCSRAIIIGRGKLVADDTPAALEARSRYCGAVSILPAANFAMAPEAIEQKLRAVAGVSMVERDAQGHYTAFAAAGAQIAESVRELIAREQWAVREWHVERGRLDDVFRNVTGGNP